MRKILVATFCATLLVFMLLPSTISSPIEIQLEADDSIISESSSRSASTGALAWEWAQKAGGSGANDQGNAIDVDSNGNVYVTGAFEQTVTFGSTTLTSAGRDDIFVAKMNSTGRCGPFKQEGIPMIREWILQSILREMYFSLGNFRILRTLVLTV